MVSLKDVAEKTGFSIRTVNRALKSDGYVAPATRERVLAAAERLGYRANLKARALRTGLSYEIGVVLGTMDELKIAKMTSFEQTLREAGFSVDVLFGLPGGDPTRGYQGTLETLLDRQPAAVALFPEHGMSLERMAMRLVQSGIPYVVFDPEAEYMDPGELHAVRIDRGHGVRLAVRHLFELGHRNIAYLGGVADRSRLDGYEAETRNLELEPIVLDTDAWEGEFESGWNGGELFLAADPRPDAVQVFSDVTAMGLLAFLHEQGLRVPEDVAVVGFDDRQIASVCWPALTTVAMPNHEVGVAAAEILLAKITGEPAPAAGWSRTVATRLKVRDST